MPIITKEYIFKNQKHFDQLDNILTKIVQETGNKYFNNENQIKSLLSNSEIKLINYLYQTFKKEIDLLDYNFKKNTNFRGNRSDFIKTLSAWQNTKFIRDSRTFIQLLENVEKGWDIEDKIFNAYRKMNLKVEKTGLDSQREFSLFSFNSTPDLMVENIYVEVQYGTNCFFKENKLKTSIDKESYIIYFHTGINKIYLFSPKELIDISKNTSKAYRFKKGSKFNVNDYNFTNFKDANIKLLNKI